MNATLLMLVFFAILELMRYLEQRQLRRQQQLQRLQAKQTLHDAEESLYKTWH